MHFSSVVIILFIAGLYKSVFSAYTFGKTRFSSFHVLVFRFSVSLVFSFEFFCYMFWIQCHLKRLYKIWIIRECNQYLCFNFVLPYTNDLPKKYKNHAVKNMFPETFWVYQENCHFWRKTSFIKKNLELQQESLSPLFWNFGINIALLLWR